MKKSERQAKEKLRGKDLSAIDHVPVVTRRGAGLQYNEGQAVKQGFGSGLRDAAAALRKRKS